MRHTYKYWTEKQDDELRELYTKDTPVKEIAELLGRTRSSCCNRARIIGITDAKRPARISARTMAAANKDPEFVARSRAGRVAAGVKRRQQDA